MFITYANAYKSCVLPRMQTLMDKEKREAYDAIAGFSGTAMNPFHDTKYERNQVLGRGLFYSLARFIDMMYLI